MTKLVRGRDIFKKEGYSMPSLRLETFKKGGILQLEVMFYKGVLFTAVKKAKSKND